MIPKIANLTELPGVCWVRSMSCRERASFVAATKQTTEDKLPLTLVCLCACDQAGQRLFEREDDLLDLPAVTVDAIALAALKANGLSQDSVEQAKNA